MKKGLLTILLVIALLFVFVVPVQAATVNLLLGESVDSITVWHNGTSWQYGTDNAWQQAGHAGAGCQMLGGGMRFRAVAIPQDAIITSACLELQAGFSDDAGLVKSYIQGEDTDSALAFTDFVNYKDRRGIDGGADHTTTNRVAWDSIDTWTTGVTYSSPNIKAVIQEIVSRSGWYYGGNIVIFWDDHDGRSTPSQSVRRAGIVSNVRLNITYSTSGAAPSKDELGELVDELKTVVGTLDTRIDELGAQANRLSNSASSLSAVSSRLEGRLTSLENKLNVVSSGVATLETVVDTLRFEVPILKAEVEALRVNAEKHYLSEEERTGSWLPIATGVLVVILVLVTVGIFGIVRRRNV